MKLKYLTLILFAMAFNATEAIGQQLSNDELLEILGIKVWRVPLPGDTTMEWGIEIVDYAQRKYSESKTDKQPSSQQTSPIALREYSDDTYEFIIKHRNGTSKGKIQIDLCAGGKNSACDNSYTLEWHDIPKAFDEGKKFVIADISPMLEPGKPRKQIILHQYKVLKVGRANSVRASGTPANNRLHQSARNSAPFLEHYFSIAILLDTV